MPMAQTSFCRSQHNHNSLFATVGLGREADALPNVRGAKRPATRKAFMVQWANVTSLRVPLFVLVKSGDITDDGRAIPYAFKITKQSVSDGC